MIRLLRMKSLLLRGDGVRASQRCFAENQEVYNVWYKYPFPNTATLPDLFISQGTATWWWRKSVSLLFPSAQRLLKSTRMFAQLEFTVDSVPCYMFYPAHRLQMEISRLAKPAPLY